jgi:hypothetical protein
VRLTPSAFRGKSQVIAGVAARRRAEPNATRANDAFARVLRETSGIALAPEPIVGIVFIRNTVAYR